MVRRFHYSPLRRRDPAALAVLARPAHMAMGLYPPSDCSLTHTQSTDRFNLDRIYCGDDSCGALDASRTSTSPSAPSGARQEDINEHKVFSEPGRPLG